MRAHLLVAVLALGAAAVAQAEVKRQIHYVGIHPVAKSEGGGFCYIEGPHVHLYEADKLQYRTYQNANFFIGDPVAYGYDGPKKQYKGHHPIHVHAVVGMPEPDVEFCYLDGPHFHAFAEAPGPDFKIVGDTYFYVAEPPKVYVDARPMYVGINAIYTPLVYTRPVVVVEPPIGWIHARAGFMIGGPAVIVEGHGPRGVVVAPGVGVGVGVGVHVGVGVGVVVPRPPPPPKIRVQAGIGIGVGAGVRVNGGGKVKIKGKR